MYGIITLMMVLLLSPLQAAEIGDIEAAVMTNNFEQGKTLAQQVLKSTAVHKTRITAYYYLGLCQLRLGEYVQARNSFHVVMGSDFNQDFYEKSALGLVESLHMAGFYKDALKEGKKLLSKFPNSQSKSLIYLKIARAHLKLMKWDDAKWYLNALIKEFPNSFEAPIAESLLEEKEFFTVQVGAFINKDKALELAEDLKAKRQYAYIVETTSRDGNKYYRVRVGQMTSLNQAQNVQTQLSRQGFPSLIYP
jgi:tetratricopeptide (TPR) repeat protein